MADEPGLDRLVMTDIETTGLTPNHDMILEVGFMIVDAATLEIVDDYSTTIWDSPTYDAAWALFEQDDAYEYVKNMHSANGLLAECQATGASLPHATGVIRDFLVGHGVKGEPLCGSSVHFDRSFLAVEMPEVEDLFYYRNIDISTVKELCKRFAPEVYPRLEIETDQKKLHRVIPDMHDTLDELRWYRANFLGRWS